MTPQWQEVKNIFKEIHKKNLTHSGGAWVAQLVKHPTLGFSSGHDLTVREFQPHIGLHDTAWSLLGILSIPLFLCSSPARVCARSLALSLSQIKT